MHISSIASMIKVFQLHKPLLRTDKSPKSANHTSVRVFFFRIKMFARVSVFTVAAHKKVILKNFGAENQKRGSVTLFPIKGLCKWKKILNFIWYFWSFFACGEHLGILNDTPISLYNNAHSYTFLMCVCVCVSVCPYTERASHHYEASSG